MNYLGIVLPGPRRLLGLGRLTSAKIIRSRLNLEQRPPNPFF